MKGFLALSNLLDMIGKIGLIPIEKYSPCYLLNFP